MVLFMCCWILLTNILLRITQIYSICVGNHARLTSCLKASPLSSLADNGWHSLLDSYKNHHLTAMVGFSLSLARLPCAIYCRQTRPEKGGGGAKLQELPPLAAWKKSRFLSGLVKDSFKENSVRPEKPIENPHIGNPFRSKPESIYNRGFSLR